MKINQNNQSDLDEILSLATGLTTASKALVWIRSPLRDFDFKTPQELVMEGHADAVKKHLRMLADGVYP